MTTAGGLPVLTYHGFGPRRSVTTTDPWWFAETLAALGEAGYRALDLGDWVARGRPDEPRGFALAFDDGLRSVLQVVDVLARHRATATVFLVTGCVGTEGTWRGATAEPLLTWPEIASLADAGFRFAAHGVTHQRLDRFSPVQVDDELRRSRATIEDRLGRPCRLLAYPYGVSAPDVRLRASARFEAAFGTRLDYANGAQDFADLSRIDAYYLRAPRVLGALLAGRLRGWLRWRRVLRSVRRGVLGPVGAGRAA